MASATQLQLESTGRSSLERSRSSLQETKDSVYIKLLGEVRSLVEQSAKLAQEQRVHKQELLQVKQDAAARASEVQSLRTELTRMMPKDHLSSAVREETAKVVGEELATVKAEREQLHTQLVQLKQETKQHQESIDKARHETMQVVQRLQVTMEKTKSETFEVRDVGLSAGERVLSLAKEFHQFRQLLYDHGVLLPKVPEPSPEEPPPVGTLAMGEDVFTCRLLTRLGLTKGKLEKDQRREAEGSTTSPRQLRIDRSADEGNEETSLMEESSLEFSASIFDNVYGISAIGLAKGWPGYAATTTGMLAVCVMTFLIQFLILLVMVKVFIRTDNCYKPEDAPVAFVDLSWWLLHLSRSVAMVIAGAVLSKELMDTTNYFMVSWLIFPHVDYEVCVGATLRIALQALVIAANVFVFMSSINPADVWLNMTALAFISSLGADVLDATKRGVFGHYICKAVTEVNYELTFMQEYPRWFPHLHSATLVSCMAFTLILAVYLFVAEDPVCE